MLEIGRARRHAIYLLFLVVVLRDESVTPSHVSRHKNATSFSRPSTGRRIMQTLAHLMSGNGANKQVWLINDFFL